MSEVKAIDPSHLNRREAERIAKEIDNHAGGFFHNALVRAALMGAEKQRDKLRGGSSA